MEKKIFELIKVANEYSENSQENYVELNFDFYFKRIEISIRNKRNFDYINTTTIEYENGIFTIEDIINKIKELKTKEGI